MTRYAKPSRGFRLIDGGLVGALMGLSNFDVKNTITAKAGGTQTGATQLIGGLNEVSVCATASDSVQLPAALEGTIVFVANPTAATLAVFGKEGRSDTINGTAGSTGVTQLTTIHAIYFCPDDTQWYRVLSA